ncbi:DUF192 domain-containing protein [Cohaesibacter marisflavi]|uniref:DUF192 domain-containing protein n=1 Tax=Cohaesibacter marisflavi TaxID=655353 RepID=UPI0029C7F848|nr:DUF192 domain-containing protein [Cohaesibacter marisflavi]
MQMRKSQFSLQSLILLSLIVYAGLAIWLSAHAHSAQIPATISEYEISTFLAEETHLVIKSGQTNHAFTIELALDDASRMKGLMYRTSLADRNGMLFDFGNTEPVYMWMKNTYISLDMIFVEPDGRIHHIVKGTTPLSESVIGSAGPVRYVLEVPKGTVDKLNIKVGDELLHQLFTPKLSK